MTPTDADPGLPGDKILRALARYHLLTREQLTRLLYRPSSTTFVGEHLTRLTRAGYLRMGRVPLTTPVGGTPGYWALRERGRRYLQAAGVDVPPLDRSPMPSPYHLRHLVALNDALIALELLCRADPRVEIERLRHERVLRRAAPRVQLPDGRATTVIPDAWIDLLVGGAPMGIALELDRGTEDARHWNRKIAGLLALASGPYRDAFGTDSMTVAVVVTGGARRAADLRRWTEGELLRAGKRHWGDLFRFAAVASAGSAGTPIPASLYLESTWLRPFDPTPRPLVDPSG